jgi:peptide/nickel transport system ATP-binding protein
VKSPSTIAAWVPPSVGYADISPSRGEIGRWCFTRLTNSTSAIWQKASVTPISPLEGEMSGRTEGGNATPQGNQIGPQLMWRREKTG